MTKLEKAQKEMDDYYNEHRDIIDRYEELEWEYYNLLDDTIE